MLAAAKMWYKLDIRSTILQVVKVFGAYNLRCLHVFRHYDSEH